MTRAVGQYVAMDNKRWAATVTGQPLYTAPSAFPNATWIGTYGHGIRLGIVGMTPFYDDMGPYVDCPVCTHRAAYGLGPCDAHNGDVWPTRRDN